jgi:hypothetical protein
VGFGEAGALVPSSSGCAVRFLHLRPDALLACIQVIELVPMYKRYVRMINHQRGKVLGDIFVTLAQIVHFGRGNIAQGPPCIFSGTGNAGGGFHLCSLLMLAVAFSANDLS